MTTYINRKINQNLHEISEKEANDMSEHIKQKNNFLFYIKQLLIRTIFLM